MAKSFEKGVTRDILIVYLMFFLYIMSYKE